MPDVKGCKERPAIGRDVDGPILDEAEMKQVCRFVSKLADNVSAGEVTHRGNVVKVKIEAEAITLECVNRKDSCIGFESYQMPDGRSLQVCPRLSPLGNVLTATRKSVDSRKVGKYLYKLQLQDGHRYWYVQYTVGGKSKPLYLGKDEPTFDPKKDISRVKRKRARKSKQAAAGTVAG
ncbi:MAG: hypothetical protein QOD75_2033 [Blastocatellia bacterium]|jgi:hypothetical protein|nr:hypothetical protein [Blastocatellia bacterium]